VFYPPLGYATRSEQALWFQLTDWWRVHANQHRYVQKSIANCKPLLFVSRRQLSRGAQRGREYYAGYIRLTSPRGLMYGAKKLGTTSDAADCG